jgi:hypothetical protein
MSPIQEPAWLLALREQVSDKGQRVVGKEIGYSPAVVSQVLNNKYGGDLKQVEKCVRGAYMGETVLCPVMGEVSVNRCLEVQKQPFASTNPQRVRLYRACRGGCDNSQLDGRKS